ncbi:MAG: helix-turn-helix transcriptional regulator [Bradyrhizobium sp.]|nr:helix-turn-helix transcriptional regulator [Bradyrhizobium sp.]
MTKFKTSRQIASDVRAMISYDVNQGDIAKELRVSRAYLSEFLSGKREVSSAILKRSAMIPSLCIVSSPHGTARRPAAPKGLRMGLQLLTREQAR